MNRFPPAVIESGVILKTGPVTTSFGKRICLTATLRLLDVGQSFVIDTASHRSSVYTLASRAGIRICTEKTKDGHLRIQRVE